MNTFSASRKQAGFTLVELVTVILILGVLAAVALPKYADLQGKAREAKVKTVAGSIKSAAGLAKAAALVSLGTCSAATSGTVSMEGSTIALNHCYPQALGSFSTGILLASNVAAADGWQLSTTNVGGSAVASTLGIELSDAATPASCSVTYTSPSAINTPAVVTVTTTGC
jgi:MSHA pilin protein MshA